MLNIESFRDYCLSKKGVSESFPFDETTLVFKVGGKMFALTSLESLDLEVNLKCDPEWAIELREEHPSITPGFHMNKKHWNSVLVNEAISESFFYQLVEHSYELVVRSLTKKMRKDYGL
jgi:predicted DNA-binding protein (MmcQ/YjbR family)